MTLKPLKKLGLYAFISSFILTGILGHAAQATDTDPEWETLNAEVMRLYRAKDYPQAIEAAKSALRAAKKSESPNRPRIVVSMNNLARLHDVSGNYVKAKQLYQRVWEIHEETLGQQHPQVAQTINNLALLHSAHGNYTAAEPLHRRALEIVEQTTEPRHEALTTVLNNFAALHKAQGNYTKAKPLYERMLEIHEETLGSNHPAMAHGLNNLAAMASIQGDYVEAERLWMCKHRRCASE